MSNQPQPVVRRAYGVTEFCEAFGVSRATVYAWMATGTLRTVRIGGRRLIPADVAEALLQRDAT